MRIAFPSLSLLSRSLVTAIVLAATACLPPERPAKTNLASQPVRVWERDSRAASTGVLVRLTADSVTWRSEALVGSSLPLSAVSRIEVAEPLSQRAAMRRGMLRGALVGGVLGAGLLAAKPKAIGGAVGLTIGTAWIAGVMAGQKVESPKPPLRWRVVHPRPAE